MSTGVFESPRAGARRLAVNQPWSGNDCQHASQALKPKPLPWDGSAEDFFEDYRRLEDVGRFLEQLEAQRPDLAVLREIGRSWEGRPLRLLEITDFNSGTAEDKPCIFLEAGVHAREWISVSAVLYIASSLLNEADTLLVNSLLKKFVFSILVPVNPDGYVYTWEVDRMWRKTRSNRRSARCRGAIAGVDANRNWGFTWSKTEDRQYAQELHDPCTEVYIGPSEFSEPETKAPAEYMRQRQLRSLRHAEKGPDGHVPGPGYVAAFLDFHSFAQVLLPPWGYTAKTPDHPDGQYQTGLTAIMVQAFRNASGRYFRAGADVFPPDPGTGPDWAYGELGIRATMTVELEGNSFCLPAGNIKSVGAEQWAGVKAMALYLVRNGAEPSRTIGTFRDEAVQGSAGIPTGLLIFAAVACAVPLCLVLCWASRKCFRKTGDSSRRPYSKSAEEELE